ncbi:MAG: di-trans,poly-cis-decaprenylcistransferase [Candidatus Eisenbacteria bacterium]|uniref:Isoprenyl transferase n=1 Tax=Eiseniibacteriota bacterium TaxID=2212470 RepID=A0A538U6J0_UNCEI|nr:MAG: di-trans,poly-cis-decaprenylcistransferase [Candidatus Eisenbacteria bacterium]
MNRSTSENDSLESGARAPAPRHVAIIMDGNGRWARARGLPRLAGHREGAVAVRRAVEAAARLGIRTLTLFAFSGDNWKRPPDEVAGLLVLFRRYLAAETPALVRRRVRLSVMGRRDRLPAPLRRAVSAAERATAGGRGLHLRIAIDYSGRDAILGASRRGPARSRAGFARRLGLASGGGAASDVDLLIRTGGEHRLSDFLLWESAYAELTFASVMWPDFTPEHLETAVSDFRRRERRFGGLSKRAAS